MPQRAKVPCAVAGCPRYTSQEYCEEHATKRRESPSVRGYNARWQRMRRWYLDSHPLCADPYHVHEYEIAPATTVDHIIPHRGNDELFWDMDNWQALCKACHDRKTGERG